MKLNKILIGATCLLALGFSSCQRYDEVSASLNYYVEGKEDVKNPPIVYARDQIVFYYDNLDADDYVIWTGDGGHNQSANEQTTDATQMVDYKKFNTASQMTVEALRKRYELKYAYKEVGTYDARMVVSKVMKVGEMDYAEDVKTIKVIDTLAAIRSFSLKYYYNQYDEDVAGLVGDDTIRISLKNLKKHDPSQGEITASFDAGNCTVFRDGVEQKSGVTILENKYLRDSLIYVRTKVVLNDTLKNEDGTYYVDENGVSYFTKSTKKNNAIVYTIDDYPYVLHSTQTEDFSNWGVENDLGLVEKVVDGVRYYSKKTVYYAKPTIIPVYSLSTLGGKLVYDLVAHDGGDTKSYVIVIE